MQIGIEENLLPGKTIRERFSQCKEYGFEGIEIRGKQLLAALDEYKTCSKEFNIPIKTICLGWEGSLLDADPSSRRQALDDMVKLLQIGDDLGGAHLVVPPVFGDPKIADLSPYRSVVELETELLVVQLETIAERIEGLSSKLLLEPINRYETHFLNRVEQACEVAKRINSPNIRVLADVFHMNIEEDDTFEALKQGKEYIQHVHFADNNRYLPGQGQLDFPRIIQTLKDMAFDKTASIECIRWKKGDPHLEIPKSANYLKQLRQSIYGL